VKNGPEMMLIVGVITLLCKTKKWGGGVSNRVRRPLKKTRNAQTKNPQKRVDDPLKKHATKRGNQKGDAGGRN